MEELNKELVIAGIEYLIKKDVNKFVDNLALFLKCKDEVLEFLFEGTPEITEAVKKTIQTRIEDTIKSPDNVVTIKSIDFTFNYSNALCYKVVFGCYKYFDPSYRYDTGEYEPDETHTQKVYTDATITLEIF